MLLVPRPDMSNSKTMCCSSPNECLLPACGSSLCNHIADMLGAACFVTGIPWRGTVSSVSAGPSAPLAAFQLGSPPLEVVRM